MRRFIITSYGFNGQAETVYNESGVLVKIDLMDTDMKNQALLRFMDIVPVLVSEIEKAFSKTNCTIIEAGYEVTFDMFWLKYNKKINKLRAVPLWNKLTKTKQVKAYTGIAAYDKFLRSTTRQKLDPENYLRNEAWENEWK